MAAEARLLVAAEAACPSCALLPCRAAGLGLLRRGVGEDGGGRRGGRRRLACHGVLARLGLGSPRVISDNLRSPRLLSRAP